MLSGKPERRNQVGFLTGHVDSARETTPLLLTRNISYMTQKNNINLSDVFIFSVTTLVIIFSYIYSFNAFIFKLGEIYD